MPSQTGHSQIAGLAGWFIVTFLAAIVGAAASLHAKVVYIHLFKPGWAPPAAIFGPVWTFLYLLMAVAAWLVWRVNGFAAARTALCLYLVQLFFNGLWSWLFFGWQQGALALADIVLLWVLILTTIIRFWSINPLAGILLLPYLAWVSFATVLNHAVWQLNPLILG